MISVRKILLCFCFLPASLIAQQKRAQIELLHADVLEGEEQLGKNVFRLSGNVQFKHENVLMYCDSAFRYGEENRLDAFGNIHINSGDTVHAFGELLKYDGNTSKAQLFKSVRMTDGKMTLTTEFLNYNTQTNVSEYTSGGKIVDTENILTSRKGYYFANEKSLFFKDSVVLNNPKYIMEGDTLKYNTVSKTSFFFGPTTIDSKGSDSTFIFCNYGWYNTETEKSYFSDKAFIQSKNQRLYGDSLLYDRKNGVGQGFNNVRVFDIDNNTVVNGDYAIYYEFGQQSLVTGNTLFIKIFESDSMFLHSDTLFATWDTVTKQKTYLAFHHCRIFKSDLQGKCDSLAYSSSDSSIRFYNNPVLWSDENQLTADSIKLQTANSKIDKMDLYNTSFITSKVDSLRFNQVRGKNMTGYFKENKLFMIDVTGNGQTVYYVKEEKDSVQRLTGVNRAECSDMVIYVKENKVNKILLKKKPAGTLYPIYDLKPEELKLKGFTWQETKRPVSKEDIFNWR